MTVWTNSKKNRSNLSQFTDILYLTFIVVGAIGALLVGLVGAGASATIMPTLVLVFPVAFPGFEVERMAGGTTMASMVVGALAAAIARHRSGDIHWPLFRLAIFPYVAGALVGPWISSYLPIDVLRSYISLMLGAVAILMLVSTAKVESATRNYQDHLSEIRCVLLVIGVLSSTAGIASGFFAIPYLLRFSLPSRTVVGTSTVCAALYATAGTIGFVSAGWSAPGLPEHTLGYVYIPAFLIISVVAVFFAPLGVWLSRFLDGTVLKRVFGVMLVLVAAYIGLVPRG